LESLTFSIESPLFSLKGQNIEELLAQAQEAGEAARHSQRDDDSDYQEDQLSRKTACSTKQASPAKQPPPSRKRKPRGRVAAERSSKRLNASAGQPPTTSPEAQSQQSSEEQSDDTGNEDDVTSPDRTSPEALLQRQQDAYERAIREHDPYCDLSSSHSTENYKITGILLARRGRSAVKSLQEIVTGWRGQDTRPKELLRSVNKTDKESPEVLAPRLTELIVQSSAQGCLSLLMNTWGMLRLFRILDKMFGHFERFNDFYLQRVRDELGVDVDQIGKRKLAAWRTRGKQLHQLSPDSLQCLTMFCLLPRSKSNA
jgi:hypothetical protein